MLDLLLMHSGPHISGQYLRVLVKPYVDLLIQGKDLYWNHAELKTLSMDALDYISGCYFDPDSCK